MKPVLCFNRISAWRKIHTHNRHDLFQMSLCARYFMSHQYSKVCLVSTEQRWAFIYNHHEPYSSGKVSKLAQNHLNGPICVETLILITLVPCPSCLNGGVHHFYSKFRQNVILAIHFLITVLYTLDWLTDMLCCTTLCQSLWAMGRCLVTKCEMCVCMVWYIRYTLKSYLCRQAIMSQNRVGISPVLHARIRSHYAALWLIF